MSNYSPFAFIFVFFALTTNATDLSVPHKRGRGESDLVDAKKFKPEVTTEETLEEKQARWFKAISESLPGEEETIRRIIFRKVDPEKDWTERLAIAIGEQAEEAIYDNLNGLEKSQKIINNLLIEHFGNIALFEKLPTGEVAVFLDNLPNHDNIAQPDQITFHAKNGYMTFDQVKTLIESALKEEYIPQSRFLEITTRSLEKYKEKIQEIVAAELKKLFDVDMSKITFEKDQEFQIFANIQFLRHSDRGPFRGGVLLKPDKTGKQWSFSELQRYITQAQTSANIPSGLQIMLTVGGQYETPKI